jgi:glutaredoxin
MIVKVFWQERCPTCPQAKALGERLEEEGLQVEYWNVKMVSGLTEAILHDVMSTPSVVLVDEKGQELAAWRSTTPNYHEIKKILAN